MTNELFETLLHQQESETLDFKLEQYLFDKATDDQRGELLKDLLAFANAWRTTDAYILIGVEEKRGSRSFVRGIPQHILNRNLQQFVNSTINRPLTFNYSGFNFEGRDVGIFEIPVQDRPLFLLKDFGQLKANLVYIRRGDTTGVATPDEVFKMGRAAGMVRQDPALTWEFADLESRARLGNKVAVESQYAILPRESEIPEYGTRVGGGFVLPNSMLSNPNYYSELAKWINDTMLLVPLGVAMINPSTAAAEDVVLTLNLDSSTIVVLSDSQMPKRPSKETIPSLVSMSRNQRALHAIEVSRFGTVYEVRYQFGTVQPGTTAWARQPLYVGARETASVAVTATISANNLSTPRVSDAEIVVGAVPRHISVQDLVRFR